MSNRNNNAKAAEAAALAKKQIEDAKLLVKSKEDFLSNLPDTSSEEEKEKAITELEDAKNILESLTNSKKTSKKVKVKALINLQGKYKLAWSQGQDFEIDEKQAKELEEVQAVKIIK